jgi:hypothetical protein
MILNNNLVIPHTAYRIGYYHFKINCELNNQKALNKKKIVLEIGGGFGLLAYFQTKNTSNSCYIIVDIPNVGILSSYFLIKLGLNVCLYGEYDKLDDELFSKYDVIIIPPDEITKIPKKSCDFIINTASFTEMSKESIIFYIQEINRIRPTYLYTDGHLNIQNDEYVQYCIQNYLTNYIQVYKNKTPIVYDDPPLFVGEVNPSIFEERLYKNNDLCL